MNKERIKSVVLSLLVIFNLLLAEKILVDKKLWPSGYNFFSMEKGGKNSDFDAGIHLVSPERIIVNTGYQSSRFEYLRDSREYNKISTSANAILKKAFSSELKSVQQVASESWYSSLSGKSVYLSLPCKFSSQNFAELIDAPRCELDIKGFSDIVITDTGDTYVYDTYQNVYYRISTTLTELSPIIEEILAENPENTSVINYSFDLNFDKDFGDQRTFLSPMIPIYSDSFTAKVISSENPIMRENELYQRAIDGILSAFSISAGTVWRYTEADGSLVFVENHGILKISPDGILTYQASDTGLSLNAGAASPLYQTASSAAEFVDMVNAGAQCHSDFSLTSPLTEAGSEVFTFDYVVGGLPVKFDGQSAVRLVLRDGYIKEYTQVLRRYTPLSYSEASPLYIEALDNVIAEYRDAMNQINITKMLPSYIDNLELGEKLPDWFVQIDNVVAE